MTNKIALPSGSTINFNENGDKLFSLGGEKIMSGYHYAARKTKGDFGEDLFEIVEVYPDLDAHTANQVHITAEGSKEKLADWLRVVAMDIEQYDVIEEDEC